MLHWWLIPVFAVLLVAVWAFYLAVKRSGGAGVRTDGRTLVDHPEPEQEADLPP
jgi:hypothetical protein